jgi:hypothetical protein
LPPQDQASESNISPFCNDPYHGSLDPEEYRSLLAAAGFAVIAHTSKDPACGHRTVWLAQQGG